MSGESSDANYWVEIFQSKRKLGAGFVLTRHYVLTALHCLRGLDPSNLELELSFASGEVVPGRVYQRAPEADLALVDILKPRDSAFRLPNADRAAQGDTWFAPYRPRGDDPHLAGDVVSGATVYRCEGGDEIEALQLNCSQDIGGYSGYSGSPVERHGANQDPSLIGMLLEEYPDRRSDRASGVLFAATIAEAMRRFDCLGINHLMGILTADDNQPLPTRQPGAAGRATSVQTQQSQASRQSQEPVIAKASSLLAALDEWAAGNVLNPMDVYALKLRVAERVVEGDWATDE